MKLKSILKFSLFILSCIPFGISIYLVPTNHDSPYLNLLNINCEFWFIVTMAMFYLVLFDALDIQPNTDDQPNTDKNVLNKNASLRKLLYEKYNHWDELNPIILQLEQIEKLIEGFHTNLGNNKIDCLADTEYTLRQAEESICRNVYVCVSYMNIYDPDCKKDLLFMNRIFRKCHDENSVTLEKSKDLILAVTALINRQNDEDNGNDLLDTYLQTIHTMLDTENLRSLSIRQQEKRCQKLDGE